jgi:galactokinase
VVAENERTVRMAHVLGAGDLAAAGRLMTESHSSLRDDFEVSSEALDAMVDAALRSPGCHGARMTGGGFGGSCVALVAADDVATFRASTLDGYRSATGREGVAIPARAVEGTS